MFIYKWSEFLNFKFAVNLLFLRSSDFSVQHCLEGALLTRDMSNTCPLLMKLDMECTNFIYECYFLGLDTAWTA